MSTLGLIGTDGKCYAWDTRAEGYGRGEGVAALLLKPLDAALRDGDNVHAVIRETGSNQDGKTTTITSPSLESQVDLIEDCYRRAGLDISETGYVEAHMTGTLTGDAVEAEALARTFGKSREAGNPVLVGSVKTNIGHTEPVSGLAAVIKAIYTLKTGLVAPNLNYKETNPNIPLNDWNLEVPTSLRPWPADKPLRASVNNFGYGGTNAHVILESIEPFRGLNGHANGVHQHENGQALIAEPESRVYVLSAKDSAATRDIASETVAYIRRTTASDSAPSPADLAYTLTQRKTLFPWVAAVRADSLTELADQLESKALEVNHATKRPRLGFVFNGQGAQWHAMGRELINAYPVFGSSIRQADEILRDFGANWSLQEELGRDPKSTRVSEVNISQPISVALQLCLVDLLESWNIRPSAVTSHSSGEIAAAYAVGLLTFKEALGVVYYRGELALKHQKLSTVQGGMLAAGIGPEEAEKYIADTKAGRVVVACVNSPSSVTLSGDLAGIDEVLALLEEDGLFARKLKVPLAYHSHHMAAMAQDYTESLRKTLCSPGSGWNGVTFTSPVTGDVLTDAESLSPEHWVRNLTSRVLFSQAFEKMVFGANGFEGTSPSSNIDVVVEVGAHSTLSGPIRQILGERKLPYVSCLKRPSNAVHTMQDLAGKLISHGYPVLSNAVNFPYCNAKPIFVDDLPTYRWNHATRYWWEPRLNKEIRYKPYQPHELLGTSLAGANGLAHTWRNILRLSDIPWLVDHQLESNVVLPGASYVAMAIEAARLVTDATEDSITGYRLKEVDIRNALIVPESSTGVEMQFSLRPYRNGDDEYRGYFEFEVSSLGVRDEWILNCTGYVFAELTSTANGSSARKENPPQVSRDDAFFLEGTDVRNIKVEAVFSGLRDMGFYHGPMFQNLVDSRTASGRAITNLSIAEVATASDGYVLHPTTLDSIIQATYSGLPEGTREKSMVIPRSIQELYVPKGVNRLSGEKLRAFTELLGSSRRGFTSSATVVNPDGPKSDAVLRIDGFFGQAVPKSNLPDLEQQPAQICSTSTWKTDILHGIPDSVREPMEITLKDSERDFEKKLIRASYIFIHDAVARLAGRSPESWEWHHKIFYDWMKKIVDLGNRGELGPNSKRWAKTTKGMKQKLVDELCAGDASGQLVARVGQNLASIVSGDITPLELMMEGNLLNQYYMDLPRLKNRTYKHLATVSELYAANMPGAKILEIGAGTGGATKIVLEAFNAGGSGSALGHYTFTDVSSGFFEAGRKKLHQWNSLMDFKKLDIETDPLTQSFEAGQYDIIVASMVLHATKSLNRTMSNVRKLLRPGGKLVLVECTQDSLDSQLIFGTVPGWWLSEEPDRNMSPNAPLGTWVSVLKDTGYSGVDFEIGDCDDPSLQSTNIIISTAVQDTSYPSQISIVDAGSAPGPWLEELKHKIHAQTGVLPIIEDLHQAVVSDEKVCVLTLDLGKPFLAEIDESSFNKLRDILAGSRGVLWLTRSDASDVSEPQYELSTGLLRTLRQEDSTKRYIRLGFDEAPEAWTGSQIENAVRIFQSGFDYNTDIYNIDFEYLVRDGILHVPRVYPNPEQDASIHDSEAGPTAALQPFRPQEQDLVWDPELPGATTFTERLATEDLAEGSVEVESKALGISHRDVLAASDQGHDGHDFAGVISRLSPSTGDQSGLKVGDRVCGIANGRFSTRGRAPTTTVVKIPDAMTWEEAAAFPTAFTTAYQALFRIARLQVGEKVLITDAAASSIGRAAVTLAKASGAEVFATYGAEAEQDLLVNNHGIDKSRLFGHFDAGFLAAVKAQTQGAGFAVVLRSLPESPFKSVAGCAARFGRFVDVRLYDSESSDRVNTSYLADGASYTRFHVSQFLGHKDEFVHEALVGSMRIFQSSEIPHPWNIDSLPLPDIGKALKQSGEEPHRQIVLNAQEGGEVNVISRPFSLDDPDSSYLIVGGLGGIGRAVALWLFEKGAKNIIVTSRKAESHPSAPELSSLAAAAGCRLLLRNCDTTQEAELVALIKEASKELPPIRGVINAAMVLDDTVVERMSFTQWRRAVSAKVSTTLNLHNHLPDLSFFIMLSSVTGITGSVSQANYAVGNTFQDAFARYRTKHGQPAVALDLSAVASAGFVAEAGEAARSHIEKLGSISVEIDAVLKLVEAAIRNPLRKSADESQVIVGLAPWDSLADGAATRRDRRFGTLRLGVSRDTSGGEGDGAANSGAGSKSSAAAIQKSLGDIGSLTRGKAESVIADATADKLAGIFNVPESNIDHSLPLSQYGVDSLVAVDLRNWLSAAVKAKVSIFEILHNASLTEFAGLVVTKSEMLKGVVEEVASK
ncbi:Type I Iterative PKS [Diaporthe eres]|uniref:Type I Iterative PKS n=1 Tax=Diaporthe eres TaxID=83184 RepID=A0ABR1PE41_DIAER